MHGGWKVPKKIFTKAIDLLFRELDADGSGQVDFKELNKMLRQAHWVAR